MRKFLFFAIALVASAMAFTSCENNGIEPELIGTVYHYRGSSGIRDGFSYEHDIYIAFEDNGKMTMKWVGVKASENAKPATIYLYDGQWMDEEGGYYFGCDATPLLPNGKPFSEWDTFDVSGRCNDTECILDYHINGVTNGAFYGEIVKD